MSETTPKPSEAVQVRARELLAELLKLAPGNSRREHTTPIYGGPPTHEEFSEVEAGHMAGVDIGERRLALLLQSVLEQLDAESARRTAWEERVVAYLRDVNVVVGRLCRAFPFLSPPMRVPTTDGKSEP